MYVADLSGNLRCVDRKTGKVVWTYASVEQVEENTFAPGFKASATAPDGIIEAIEDPAARFCLGVQWHPENFWRTGEFRPLFEGFVEAAATR